MSNAKPTGPEGEGPLTLSFIDVLMCAFGAYVLLYFIYAVMPHFGKAGHKAATQDASARVILRGGIPQRSASSEIFLTVHGSNWTTVTINGKQIFPSTASSVSPAGPDGFTLAVDLIAARLGDVDILNIDAPEFPSGLLPVLVHIERNGTPHPDVTVMPRSRSSDSSQGRIMRIAIITCHLYNNNQAISFAAVTSGPH